MPFETLPPRALQVLRILWASITMSTLLFLFILTQVRLPARAPDPILVPVMAMAALGALGIGIFLPVQALKRSQKPGVFQTAAILGLACTESVALFGLVLGFLGFGLPMFLPFFAVAWIVFLLRFPRATHPLGVLGPSVGGR